MRISGQKTDDSPVLFGQRRRHRFELRRPFETRCPRIGHPPPPIHHRPRVRAGARLQRLPLGLHRAPLSLVVLSLSRTCRPIPSASFITTPWSTPCSPRSRRRPRPRGTYRVTQRHLQPSAFLELRELSFGVGAGCVLTLAAAAFLHVSFGTAEAPATQLVMAVIVTILVISFGRILLRYFLRASTSTRVLVVGTGTLAERIKMSVRQDPGMTLVGRAVDDDVVDAERRGPSRRSVRAVPAPGRAPHPRHGQRPLLSRRPSTRTASCRTLCTSPWCPRYYELISWRSRLTDLGGMPFLEIARPHLSVWDRFMKRAFDVCMSSFVLVVTSPLLVAVAIGVKLSSPGPVFFRQVRLGRHQQPFTVTKFRSMTVGDHSELAPGDASDDAPEDHARPLHEARGKLDESARITPIGAFLRKTGIDEIPQFINVFKGDMSVVGPRPFVPKESTVDGWATRRFEVRPGITGLWQVSGRNDLSRNDLVQLDYLYVASWSLWWDLKIMWETPRTMARGTGAY